MPDRPSAARCAIGPDGRAAELTVESRNDVGLGTLKRTGK